MFLPWCVANSSVFVSDKDLNYSNMDQDEFGLLLRPAMEIHKEEYCQISTLEERDQDEDNKEHQAIISVALAPPPMKNLKLEIPSYEEVVGSENVDESIEGLKTPTSLDQKFPVILECPGAPRKRKSRPAKKPRTCRRRRIVLDMSKELESLFAMPFMVDLCAGGKKKRVEEFSGNDQKL